MALEPIELNPGTGGDLAAADDLGASGKAQVVKLILGADGVNDGLVASGNPLPVSDAGGSLTVDGTVAVSGSVAVTDNAGSLTVDNAALSVTGGGVEATALRVTLASDSTGVVSVDDGGGTLTVDGSVTANAGTDLNTSLLALEAGGNLAGAATSLAVIDDWDESDRAKTNPIVGQAGVQGGSGAVSATTQRVVLATDVALPAGTNAIGKLAANNGVDIGDVDVTSLPNVTLAAGTNTNEVVGDVAHDAPAAGNPLLMAGYASAAAPTDVSGDADAVRAWHLRNGAQATVVTAAGALIGGDASNGLDVDVTRLPALVAGSANIGDVDVLTVPAPLSTTGGGTEAAALRVTIATDSTGVLSIDDNGSTVSVDDGAGSLTIDNAALAVTGGGVEATALRVTIASDSTGVLSIDDNGGAITVDGTITAVGGAANDAPVSGNPNLIAGRASVAAPSDVSGDGDAVTAWLLRNGAACVNLTAAGALIPGDATNGLKVQVATLPASTNTIEVVGDVAAGAAVSGNPVQVGYRADTTAPSAVSDGQVVQPWADEYGALTVKPSLNQISISATPTIDTAVYSSGDRLGTVMTFASAALVSGRSGTIIGALLFDDAASSFDIRLHLFKVSPTLDNADNGALSLTDANLATAIPVGVIEFTAANSHTYVNNRICQGTWLGGPLAMPFVTSGSSSLFGILEARGAYDAAATDDLVIVLNIARD